MEACDHIIVLVFAPRDATQWCDVVTPFLGLYESTISLGELTRDIHMGLRRMGTDWRARGSGYPQS
jgi:hypothetical protein